jgi:drug/metabolite transporter (DMT)-like permease
VLVTTVVFALPLGYLLTQQHVGRREVIGAVVIVLGFVLFAAFGDLVGGRENAPGSEWAIAIAVLAVACAALLLFAGRGGLTMRAAVDGTPVLPVTEAATT